MNDDDKKINNLATAMAELLEDSGLDPPACLMAVGMVANEIIYECFAPHRHAETARAFSALLHESLANNIDLQTTHH